MAQQTQVSRVKVFYSRWLKKFPTLTSLARASVSDVLRAWSGLGYNSRALRFHQTAQIVVQQPYPHFPQDPEELMALAGIGRYTAHAVACFAFHKRLPVVDVNIRRILTRWSVAVKTSDEVIPEQEAWSIADRMLPPKKFYDWNQALMDFGAQVCTSRNPKCSECPVHAECASGHSKAFLLPPVSKIKTEPSWKEIPRRLYRGRVLKLLHRTPLTAERLAKALCGTASKKDVIWIRSVLAAMESEGLIVRRNNTYRLAS